MVGSSWKWVALGGGVKVLEQLSRTDGTQRWCRSGRPMVAHCWCFGWLGGLMQWNPRFPPIFSKG